jgi:hypothetical protein
MLSGGMMIGTDSHTVNAGLGMVATWCWWCWCGRCHVKWRQNPKLIG